MPTYRYNVSKSDALPGHPHAMSDDRDDLSGAL